LGPRGPRSRRSRVRWSTSPRSSSSARNRRSALGSSARAIFDLVIREGLLLVGAGFLLGGVGAFVLRGSLESQLFGISAADPLVVGGVTLLLALVALVACTVPARRATRIDPRIALTE
jgi:putative ABC transport system permease protein